MGRIEGPLPPATPAPPPPTTGTTGAAPAASSAQVSSGAHKLQFTLDSVPVTIATKGAELSPERAGEYALYTYNAFLEQKDLLAKKVTTIDNGLQYQLEYIDKNKNSYSPDFVQQLIISAREQADLAKNREINQVRDYEKAANAAADRYIKAQSLHPSQQIPNPTTKLAAARLEQAKNSLAQAEGQLAIIKGGPEEYNTLDNPEVVFKRLDELRPWVQNVWSKEEDLKRAEAVLKFAQENDLGLQELLQGVIDPMLAPPVL